MGESLQQLAGDRLRHILDSLTTNRFTSLLTGALVTAMIQSSTAASLMTVSFVHAGMLTLVQALPILMGASVGNTFIAWIMAAEFNFSISNYIYPLILVAFIMTYYRKWNALGNSIFGLCFILLSLGLLCHMADDMTLTGPDGIARYLAVSHENYGSYAILLFIGAAVTFGVQSSAVLMATSMALCSTGVWSIYSGVAFVLGENIGRAIVTCRAASSAGTPARRTALGQLATRWVAKPRHNDEEESQLRFITKGILDTPEQSIMEARKEIINYADTVTKMFTQTRFLFSVSNETEFKNIFTLVEHYEDICDEMEVDIANYLNKVSTEEPSADLKRAICGMLREVAEIESIGDSCHHIAHTARRNYRSTQQLTEKQLEHIHQMFQLAEQALEQMRTILSIRKAPREASTAYYIEREINKFRNQLRNLNFTDVNNGVYNYQTGAMYMDVINECEQLSDCILNVTEARLEAKES